MARPALLFNEGLIAEKSGDKPAAIKHFTQSLALRSATDPGRATVEKELVSVGGTPPPVSATPPGDLEVLCDVTPNPKGYVGIGTKINWKSMAGTLEIGYKDIRPRHFNVKVGAWPRGCPQIQPMPDSPVCHGPFRTYTLTFQSYDSSDAKPAGEKLVAGKTILGSVTQDNGDDKANSHFEFADLAPAVPVMTAMTAMTCK